jgi:hypothetical protein
MIGFAGAGFRLGTLSNFKLGGVLSCLSDDDKLIQAGKMSSPKPVVSKLRFSIV